MVLQGYLLPSDFGRESVSLDIDLKGTNILGCQHGKHSHPVVTRRLHPQAWNMSGGKPEPDQACHNPLKDAGAQCAPWAGHHASALDCQEQPKHWAPWQSEPFITAELFQTPSSLCPSPNLQNSFWQHSVSLQRREYVDYMLGTFQPVQQILLSVFSMSVFWSIDASLVSEVDTSQSLWCWTLQFINYL